MSPQWVLALVGSATMLLEIVLARRLGTILGNAVDGVALAITVALVGFAVGQIISASAKERRSLPSTWCRIALVGCIPAGVWVGYLLPNLVEHFAFISTVQGKILVSLPLLCGSIPLGVVVTTAFRVHSREILQRTSGGIAAIDLGSACGAILTPLLLLPVIGETGTLAVSVLLLVIASIAEKQPAHTESEVVRNDLAVSRRSILTVFWVGFIAFALQMGWVRVLGEVLGSSLLVFGISTGVSLLGGAAGALLMPEIRKLLGARRLPRVAWATWLVSQGLSLLMISFSPYFYLSIVQWCGDGFFISLTVCKALILLCILGLPAFCSGLFVPALMVEHGEKGRLDRGAGILQGWNLIGSMLGALVTTFYVIPIHGVLPLFLFCGFMTVLGGIPELRRGSRGGAASSFLCGSLLLGAASQFWDTALLGAGVFQWSRGEIIEETALPAWRRREVLTSVQGRLGTVQIERDLQHNASYLRVGGRIEGSVAIDPGKPSLADLPTELMLGLLPSWIGPGRGQMFVVGLGGGTTVATAVATWDGDIVVSEIEPAVKQVLLSPQGQIAFPDEHEALLGRKAPSIVVDDARAMLTRDARRWDAIVIQPSEPWLPWSAPLFSPEFHSLIGSRLAADGVVVQWLQLYRIGVEEFAAILSSIRQHLGPVQIWYPPGTGEVIVVAGSSDSPSGDGTGTVEAEWNRRLGPSVALPGAPWLDDEAVGRWLDQAGGGDLERLQERLEHRLPLLGESGGDRSGVLLRSLAEVLESAPESPGN